MASKEAKHSELQTLTRRFGPFVESLAESLHHFSLDVVHVISLYLVCPTAASGALPVLLLTLGEHPHKFESSIFGVGVDPNTNDIWITSYDTSAAFRADGKFLHWTAHSLLSVAKGVVVAPNGFAYIVDYLASKIAQCQLNGLFAQHINIEGAGNGQFKYPHGIAVDSKQSLLFVSDGGNRRVQVLKLDDDHSFVRAFGGAGQDDGLFSGPRGIAVSQTTGEIAVADIDRHDVQVFSNDGKFLRKFAQGKNGARFDMPYDVAFDRADNIIVCDYNGMRVSVHSSDGSFITSFDHDSCVIPTVAKPCSVCVDNDGRLVIGYSNCLVRVLAFEF